MIAAMGIDFWQRFFDIDTSSSEEIKVQCPFHEWNLGKTDENPSFQINLSSGLWQCWSCPDDGMLPKSGDVLSFVEAYFAVSYTTAKAYVLSGIEFLPIDPRQSVAWQEALHEQPNIVDKLRARHLTADAIRRFELGWDGHRVTIPIKNYRGDIVNVRRYAFGKKSNKIVSLEPLTLDGGMVVHFGQARLFPINHILDTTAPQPIWIFAGEMDTILASSLGYNAVCTTAGESYWNPIWNSLFSGRDIYIVYDIDKAGVEGAKKVANHLLEHVTSVSIVALPIVEPSNADWTDYVIEGLPSDADTLKSYATRYTGTSLLIDHPLRDSGAPHTISTLSKTAYDPGWNGKRVELEVMIPGKNLTPYTIPQQMNITCNRYDPEAKLCQGCALFRAGGKAKLTLDPRNDVLHLIRVTDEKMFAELRRMIGIPGKCQLWEQDVVEYQNVEELLLTPRIEGGVDSDLDSKDTRQVGFYFYPEGTPHVDVNQSYKLSAVRTTDPWKQQVTYIIDKIEHVTDTLTLFQMTGDICEQLRQFAPATSGLSVEDRLSALAWEIIYYRTHIYGRHDLIIGILLALCSVQQFEFQSQTVDNGLVELLVIGDTRTGKSESAISLLRWIGLGEVVTGEAVTFAGLVGGLQQGGDSHWFVTWGKIPQNHMKAVVIDEVSGLSTDQIAAMSGIRSARIAELIKVQQARTFARTRLIWMSNPRANLPLRGYTHGIEAVPELIGKPEDVARFDLVIACASGEVSDEVINQLEQDGERPPETITAEALRNLVLRAWTRRREHVIYTEEATRHTLQAALEMGRTYSSRIPIVEAANQRIKLARLAVAVATLTFSTDESGELVVVTREHVEYARRFMDAAYSKPSLDYSGFSRQEKEDERIAEKAARPIREWIKGNPSVAQMIARAASWTGNDLQEQLSLDRTEAIDHLHTLSEARMIQRGRHGYYKTAAFIALLKEMGIGA